MFWMRLIVINKLTALVFNELNGCVCCFLTRHVNSCFFGGSFNIFNKKMIKKTTVLHIYVNSLYIVSFRNGSPSPFLFQFEKQINVYIKWSALSSSGAPCHEYKRSVIHQALFLSEEHLRRWMLSFISILLLLAHLSATLTCRSPHPSKRPAVHPDSSLYCPPPVI